LLLVIDIGNTNTVFGMFSDDQLIGDLRVETRRHRTSDEYYAMLEPLVRRMGYALSKVADVVLSTVVPPTIYPVTKLARLLCGRPPMVVDHLMNVGIELLYHRPEEMGADRLVNAAWAYRQFGASIVVDFGTATTFDVIDDRGRYLGGCITPGIRISMDALFMRAARLPRIDVARPRHVIGRSTEEAMQSGVYFGYVAMVDGLVSRLIETSGFEPQVVATGGLASLIARDSATITRVERNLTLLSLAHLFRQSKLEMSG